MAPTCRPTLLYPIPASLCVLSFLHLSLLSFALHRPTTCLFFRPPLRRLSLSFSLSRTRSLALSTRSIQRRTRIELAGMRIFMRSFMPTRSLKIILGIEDRAQPTLPDRFFRPIFLPRLIPFRASTRSYENSRCLDLPPFHKRGNTFAGMQMRSLEARGHLPYNHRRNDSTLTQSVGTFHSDLTGINRLLTSPSSLPRIFSLFRPSITGNAIFLIGPRYFLKINIRNRYFTLSIRVLTNDKP